MPEADKSLIPAAESPPGPPTVLPAASPPDDTDGAFATDALLDSTGSMRNWMVPPSPCSCFPPLPPLLPDGEGIDRPPPPLIIRSATVVGGIPPDDECGREGGAM